MIYALPIPVPANINYTGILITEMPYDPDRQCYVAKVFGIVDGQPMPFIFKCRSGHLQRVETCEITEAEIDAVMSEHPEIKERRDAGLHRAMDRLYALVNS